MTKHADVKKGRHFWTAHIERFEKSNGVTQKAYARRHGLVLTTFRHWLYKLRAEQMEANAKIEAVQFVELEPSFIEAPRHKMVVEVGNVCLHLDTLPDPRWLAELAVYSEGGQ